ncbi:MAG: hypothetical protein ABIA97_06545 [Candidatus Omnitrophota bacterium]
MANCPHCNRHIPWYKTFNPINKLLFGINCRYCGKLIIEEKAHPRIKEIVKKIGKIIYEIACFILFYLLSGLLAFTIASKILKWMHPDKDMDRYIQSGGPGMAMIGGFLFIVFIVLFYRIRKIIRKNVQK